jgi:rRNA maturation endonuclease Nob1
MIPTHRQPGDIERVRTFECEGCGHRFDATHYPMGCPDCGGSLLELEFAGRD